MIKRKTYLITGVSGDIGIAIAKKLIQDKSNIICCLRKKNQKYKKFFKKNKKFISLELIFDINNYKEVDKAIYKIKEKKININGLINSAGIATGSIFEMTQIKKIKEVFDTNFFSLLYLTQKILPLLKYKKTNHIINISSVSGIIAQRGNIAYGASKASLIYSTKVLANELANYNIRVNAIAPHITKSKMLRLMSATKKKELKNQSFMKKECSVEDISETVSFLLSKKSNYINGQIIRLDGGMEN